MKQLTTKTKLIVFFFISIALPALVLAYLSLRGIQSDRAYAEQELHDRHQETAQLIVDRVVKELDRIELTTNKIVRELGQVDPTTLQSLAEKLKLSSPLVSQPFVVTKSEVLFPLTTRLFCGERGAPVVPACLYVAGSNQPFIRGIHLEYQKQDLEKAARAYAEALQEASTMQARAEVLFAKARILRREGSRRDVRRVYEQIARSCKGSTIAGGIPADLAARLELLKYSQGEQNGSRTAESVVELFEDLVDGTWSLRRSQFQFVLDRLRTAWTSEFSGTSTIPPQHETRFRRLEERVKEEVHASEELALLETRVLPELLHSIRTDVGPTSGGCRYVANAGSRTLCFIAVPSNSDSPEGIVMIGALLGTERELSAVASIVNSVMLPVNSVLQIMSDQGELVAGSPLPLTARKTVELSIPGGVPPWTVSLYHQDPQFFEQLMSARRWIYVVAMVLAVGVAAFGSIVTLRMISREVELAKLQADFVSTVSHELRSPLTSIRQLSELLQRGRIVSEERRQRYYDTIVGQSERLSLLVENILDFARLEEGKKVFHFEETDLKSFLHQVVDRIQQQVQLEGFVISLEIPEPPPPVCIDRDALAQVLANLLDNAIKFSRNAKEVAVRASHDRAWASIDVVDQGIGIRPEEIGRLFDRFYRGSGEEVRAIRGTGLGLTIVKYIVECHGGTITVRSEPGHGSTFRIKIPIKG